jgi:hypothetical protein
MPRAPDHSAANFTEAASTLSNNAATIFAANSKRRGVIIGNPSDTVMTFRIGGTASATAGCPIGAGTTVTLKGENVPSGLISLFCAGASKAYCAYEWSE